MYNNVRSCVGRFNEIILNDMSDYVPTYMDMGTIIQEHIQHMINVLQFHANEINIIQIGFEVYFEFISSVEEFLMNTLI